MIGKGCEDDRMKLCAPAMIEDVEVLIDAAINEDITYQSKPLDLRNQRTYAVKVCHRATTKLCRSWA
jgi:hypothetical protein